MTSLVCVDASFILRTLIKAPFSEQALDILDQWQQERTALIAPSHLAFEVTSVLRLYVYLNNITPDQGERAFKAFLGFNITFVSSKKLFPLAWELAKQFNRPRAYDTAYLALAHLRGCPFWTADKRIYNAVKDQLDWVKCLGEDIPVQFEQLWMRS